MKRGAATIACAVTMSCLVIGVDVLLLRHRFWDRLLVNIAIVAVFATVYLRFLKKR